MELEARNTKLRGEVDELSSSSHRHSSHLSIQRELDTARERHRKQVDDLQQTVNELRQQLLRRRANDLGACHLLSLLICHITVIFCFVYWFYRLHLHHKHSDTHTHRMTQEHTIVTTVA